MKMSYSKAWTTINLIEKRMGVAFLHRKTGGTAGGGAQLTDEAKAFMIKYRRFQEEADELLHRLYDKHFGGKQDLMQKCNVLQLCD